VPTGDLAPGQDTVTGICPVIDLEARRCAGKGRRASAMRSVVGRHAEKAIALPGLAPWFALLTLMAAVICAPAASVDDEPITPIRPAEASAGKADLGRSLFHDVRLSHGSTVACVSCHRIDRGGADDRSRSLGADGRPLDFNSPTIFNAALNYRLNWRGNFRTLEEQNEAVLLDRRLMNTTWEELLPRLRADQDYVRIFTALYGSGPVRGHVLDALATFQRSLLTPDARFDRYLNGQGDAITSEEERGYQLFKSYGCIACHQGVNLGGNLLQRFGVFYDPFMQRGARVTDADLGRFSITRVENDRFVFRVPSLRNVAVTAPYLHDGSAASLAEAVEIMARVQLGRDLPTRDIDLIVKFLETLTGEYQGRSLAAETDQSTR
jgi:cytochrome c peroxidase